MYKQYVLVRSKQDTADVFLKVLQCNMIITYTMQSCMNTINMIMIKLAVSIIKIDLYTLPLPWKVIENSGRMGGLKNQKF